MFTIHEHINGKEQILGTKEGKELHFGSKEEAKAFIKENNIPVTPTTRIVYAIGDFLMYAYDPVTLEEADYLGPMKTYVHHDIPKLKED